MLILPRCGFQYDSEVTFEGTLSRVSLKGQLPSFIKLRKKAKLVGEAEL